MREIILLVLIGVGIILNISNFSIECCDFNADYHLLLPLIGGMALLFVDKKWQTNKKIVFMLFFIFVLAVSVAFELERKQLLRLAMPILATLTAITLLISALVALSFWLNKPYFVESYRTERKVFEYVYKVISIGYLIVTVYNIISFINLLEFV